ncbi:MAG TPA: DUF167 domain-containing protein [Candidatus Sulfotelmatobacter sp.]|jgi:uncharacterized protein (TIGR00251 family)|nr:DUF167 domain-containing protein [Candidatus Sulfotelmatobacter sp.]
MVNPTGILDISENPATHSVVFTVRVQPRAGHDEVSGVMEGALKIRLRAPALENRANEALCEFLGSLLKRPKSAVRILSGDRSRTKRVAVDGVTRQQVEALLLFEA